MRVSCSFWLEYMLGSSATSRTRPALMPVLATDMNGSAATLSPTCFIVTSVRAPPMAEPMPTSSATFSLGDHSQ